MAHTGVNFPIPERYTYQGPRLQGGQGYVYIYLDTFLQRQVAIKEMKHPGDAGTLRDELAKIREIGSRHVVEVYDLFEAKRSNGLALVEEYVPGPTLEELATQEPHLAEDEVIKIMWQIACGLSDIHRHRIIHRDIKPRNIKLDAERVVKILDFGLSSIMAPESETVAARGTTHYLAPEMFDTPPIHLSWQIDVYSFGVTAWYLLNEGILPAPLKEIPPQSRNRNTSLQNAKLVLPKRVTDMLDRALDPDPSRRPRITEIRDVLRRQLTSGQHRLVFYDKGRQQELSKAKPKVTLRVGSDSLSINYDEYNFIVERVDGDVYMNNSKAEVGIVVPGSFVVTFGSPAEGSGRTFVPMTVLVPEVVL